MINSFELKQAVQQWLIGFALKLFHTFPFPTVFYWHTVMVNLRIPSNLQ